ncbi:MAG: hypothetical protein JWM77_2322 [Rhodospirillales bacterium]|jgi:hypothetical protein|nr:hypothetical protein [Rhodospirillales bacterium]
MRHFAVLGLLALAAPPCFAEGMVCLQLSSIDHTQVVDDRTILFHMRDRTTYRNVLPATCAGLKFEDGFSYATSINQLCSNVEIIRVLRRGTTCGLGAFEKLDAKPNG